MEHEELLRKVQRDLDLFRRDFENAQSNFDGRFDRLTDDLVSIEKYLAKEIKPNTKGWNQTTDSISKVVWTVVSGVIVALLALIGLR